MKNVINWIKANPISVASFALMLLSVVAIGYFMFMANPALQQRAAASPTKQINDIKRYGSQVLEVPAKNADDPPQQLSRVTVNAKTIEVLDTIYTDLNRESEQIFATAMSINQAGHQVMLEGLFPDTPPALHFSAKTVYSDVLGALLGPASRAQAVAQATGLEIPYLNAGPPLDQGYVASQIAQQAEAMQAGVEIGRGELSQTLQEQQKKEQQRELVNELLRHAKTINMYAQSELGDTLNPIPGFPLQIAALGKTPQSPTPGQLWEAQLELWVLQDVVRALGLANRVGETFEEVDDKGETKQRPYSVLEAPVKRLISLEVLPGYVGLHNTGGLDTGPRRTRGGGGRSGGLVGGDKYPPPVGGKTDQPRETATPENFAIAPTGHVSNALYDVRHVRMLAHVDFRQLPELFNAIGEVNLMTVLDAKFTAVDEFALLGEQYIYGEGDVVEAELLIETLWLREWTSPLMPEDVKIYVGLADPPEGTVPGAGGYGEYGEYGEYGDPYGGDPYGGPYGEQY